MRIEMQVMEVDGQMWLVREAQSEIDALHEIAHARVLGSIGGKSTLHDVDGETVIADVHKIVLVQPS